MSDEAIGVMTPALPSRATGEAKPLTPLPTAGVDPATLTPARRRKARHKKAERLPVREIKRINKNRRKNLKKNYPKRLTRGKGRLPPAVNSVAEHHGGRFTPEIYAAIGTIMNLDIPSRALVWGIVKALEAK